MAKFEVSSTALDKKTRKGVKMSGGKYKGKTIRKEIINTKTNTLFKGARTPKDVERIYENFWNKLDPYATEVVKVIGVKKLKGVA